MVKSLLPDQDTQLPLLVIKPTNKSLCLEDSISITKKKTNSILIIKFILLRSTKTKSLGPYNNVLVIFLWKDQIMPLVLSQETDSSFLEDIILQISDSTMLTS
jgi:hypothetical protein